MYDLFEKLILEIIPFLDYKKKNAVFGLGTTGKLIIDILQYTNFKIECIVISDVYKINTEYNKVPIYEISEFPFEKKECNILFTVKSDKNNILKILEENKFKNIKYIDSNQDYLKLLKLYYTKYFKSNNIDIGEEEVIRFEELKIINPFKLNKELVDVFFREIGDLILPIIMSDYSRIDEGAYEYNEVKLNEGDVVFDCGANIGIFSSVAAFKKCIVYAFEPIPGTIKYLEKTKNLYFDLINICPYALSNSEGYVNFEVYDNRNSENHMVDEDVTNQNLIKVKMTSIDNFVKENDIEKVDFIKADIEGSERYMLKGAVETLAKFAPKLSICTYHLEDDRTVLEDIIRKANSNYIVEHKWKKLYAYVPIKNDIKNK